MMAHVLAPTAIFSKVLIATDFGEEADRALEYAKSIVRDSKGELLLIHVEDPIPYVAIAEGAWLGDDPSRAQRDAEQTEAAGLALRAEGIRATAVCRLGDTADEVSDAVRKHNVDLVVVGTHGRHGFSRFFLGSQAERIADGLKVPVLFVGPKAPQALAKWMPSNILCATSLDKRGAQLVAYAYRFAEEHRAHLEIAYQGVSEGERDYGDWHQFKTAIKNLIQSEHSDHPHLHAIFLDEPEAESLIQAAIARRVDLLVIGISAESIEWPDLRTGSGLPKLLAEAPCPILAIPFDPHSGN